MTRMSLADFERRYQADPDPWRYQTSAYEQEKYAATLAACGPGPFRCALELAASIGVFSAMLAPRCRRLITIDAAPSAVRTARRRLAGCERAEVLEGVIPGAIPDGPYDLVVAAEILYYLTAEELEATLDRLEAQTTPGARIVAVHWRPRGPERPLSASQAHAALRRRSQLELTEPGGTRDYRLDVLRRR
jgi:cyclopropane fatty-acyl-phospholipid synthase-like methyltransferase